MTKKSSFKDLSEKDGSVSIHRRNLRTLAEEFFKVFKGLSPVIFAEAFPVRQQSQYNMRNYSYFAMPPAKTVNHGLESLSYIGSKLWDSIPSHMKEIDSINEFKHVIKTLCTKYWIFVVSVFSRLPYVIHFLSLFSYLLEFMEFI